MCFVITGVEIGHIWMQRGGNVGLLMRKWRYEHWENIYGVYTPCLLRGEYLTPPGGKIQPLSQKVILGQGERAVGVLPELG